MRRGYCPFLPLRLVQYLHQSIHAVELAMSFFVMVVMTVPEFLRKKGLPPILLLASVMPVMLLGRKVSGPALSPTGALAARLAHSLGWPVSQAGRGNILSLRKAF